MSSSEANLREIKKVIEILQTYGNVLVPGYKNIPNIKAQDKLKYLVEKLQKEEGWTIEEIQKKSRRNITPKTK
ncbi:hypothetical protein [Empedobacter sp.]|uniref:hypothetical protein n=1 Tax=Empedobacter sp. TaxID=1927715 RepID=UPI0028AD759F|nr:hypothetical protein [Empedobacter sp.]